ncbi:MAG: glycoside hydrolase family 2 protein, partial [Vicinamibacterales bacterium]
MARARILGARSAQPLGGSWQLAALAPAPAATPIDLDDLNPSWIDCDGPLLVAAALRAAGQWDVDRPRDFDSEDWWYRCRFSSTNTGEPVWLRFEGLATVVDVWLNGRCILHSDNMFTGHRVEVERGFAQDNELLLHFHALAPLLTSRTSRPRWRTRMVSRQALRWYRTSLLGRCPGWCPPVAPVGPWGPIEIEPETPLAVERADLRAELDGVDGIVRLRLEAACPAGASVVARLTVAEWESTLTCQTRADGRTTIDGAVTVTRPERWWPHTHGSPVLYGVRASIIVNGIGETVDLGRVGFRNIDLDRGADGEGFGLVVNGAPIFCRGVCWTPIDLATLSATPAEYRDALERLRDAGMNMIRISGTMVYETDAFYDLCDELGILLFQDFMFANMDYPWEDEAFARSALTEAEQVLARLQSRPALTVVCASSEVEQQAAMLGLAAARRPNRLLDEQLPDLVRTMAPAAVWLPGTPCGGAFPFQVSSGVSHYYGVGAYRRPFDDARRSGVRFSAECLAFSNVPEAATIDLLMPDGDAPGSSPRWKARVPRDAGVGWDFEDVRDHYVQQLFGVDPDQVRAGDPERYLALGRVATGEAMLRTFAEWRRPGSTCRGALVWFARDLWPGAGWGIVDSGGRPKAAYWYLKRALAPVALLTADEGLNGLWFHLINDTPEPIEAELRIAVYRDGIRSGAPVCTPVVIPGRGHRSIHADALLGGFRDLTCAYRVGPPGHDVVAATLRAAGSTSLRAAACYV